MGHANRPASVVGFSTTGAAGVCRLKTSECRVPAERLLVFARTTLERLGVPSADAEEVARCLIWADLRGIDSHGITRLPVYARRLAAGIINPAPRIRVERVAAGLLRIDGDNGLGPVVGMTTMRATLAAARENGVAMAVVRRSNHFGAAGYYVQEALAAGCIGVASSNAPPNMAPWGGRERFLGTNPIAIGIPAGHEEPVLLDMATSIVARGKIIMAAEKGEPIPSGWAIDRQGRPTTDAVAALEGAVLPFGGPKGSAISLILDILCGVLSGASFGRYLGTLDDLGREQDLGHFFAAVDISRLMPVEHFRARMDDLLQQLHGIPPAAGVERVLAPGELEALTAVQRQREGIPLPEVVVARLRELGQSLGVCVEDLQTHPFSA